MEQKDRIRIELIYEKTCPNIEAARGQLARALIRAGIPGQWTEWEISDPDMPAHARGYGSPTVLVNGRDVAGDRPVENQCCRLYPQTSGVNLGAPTVDQIVAALMHA